MSISLPNKVIPVAVKKQTGIGKWPYQDGTDDPWWEGGISPRDYLWRLELVVNIQKHSSHLTREPYEYSGYDVNVNDWIAANTTGNALKIISVESKTKTTATVIVEDVLRYNTFRDPGGAGDGSIGVGQAMIFQVNNEGMPRIDPIVSSGVSEMFFINISSRFQGFNEQFDFRLTQIGHSFELGDIVAVDPDSGSFVPSDMNFKNVIGTVSVLGPGPNDFYITPVQKILDEFDFLPGGIGDLLFTDDGDPGKITLVDTSKKEIYTKIRNHTNTTVDGLVLDATTTPGNQIEINGQTVTIAGSGTIADAETAINSVQAITGITAINKLSPSVVLTQNANLNYGEPGLFTDAPGPATATIDGVLVTFDINTIGVARTGQNIAVASDMAEAINRDMANAANTNIVADSPYPNQLRITHVNGGAITIVNGAPDTNGTNFGGAISGAGINLLTPASTNFILSLEAQDARSIELRSVKGRPLEDYGIFSAENGIKGAAIFVEKRLREAKLLVVQDMSDLGLLTPNIGDQTFVADSGNGEWVQLLWDGSQWVTIATQDSARTDANSVVLTLDFNSISGAIPITTVSDTSRITLITIEVTQAFDLVPLLTIGDDLQNDRLMDNSQHDLNIVGTYTIQSDHIYTTGSDVEINAYFNPNGSSQGQAVVVLSYQ